MAGPGSLGRDSGLLGSVNTRFQDLPMIFGKTLSQDLKDLTVEGETPLQYVDASFN